MTIPPNAAPPLAGSEPRTRTALLLEAIALRHQIAVLKRSGTGRPYFRLWDRWFWIWLARWWPSWRDSLVLVQHATVLRRRRSGWSGLWRYRSRGRWRGGRPRIEREIRHLITRMARENFLWGAPRIHGELLMLGFTVSQATLSRYMPAASRRPGQSWRTFLQNQALAFRADQDSENVSGVEYWSSHARLYRIGLVRFAVAQIALVGARRGRCGGSALSLSNSKRISIPYAQYDRDAWHNGRRACAVPGHSWRMARDRRQVTASMRSPPHEARASPRPRSSEIRDSLDCITLLRTMDAHLPAISASAEFRFPSRGLGFEKGQPSFFSWYQPLWSAKISGVSSAEHCPTGRRAPSKLHGLWRRGLGPKPLKGGALQLSAT